MAQLWWLRCVTRPCSHHRLTRPYYPKHIRRCHLSKKETIGPNDQRQTTQSVDGRMKAKAKTKTTSSGHFQKSRRRPLLNVTKTKLKNIVSHFVKKTKKACPMQRQTPCSTYQHHAPPPTRNRIRCRWSGSPRIYHHSLPNYSKTKEKAATDRKVPPHSLEQANKKLKKDNQDLVKWKERIEAKANLEFRRGVRHGIDKATKNMIALPDNLDKSTPLKGFNYYCANNLDHPAYCLSNNLDPDYLQHPKPNLQRSTCWPGWHFGVRHEPLYRAICLGNASLN
jgi:hypothetical protein